jgi:regulator of protease activity HflC (stomatin/prohibitin superfamily)
MFNTSQFQAERGAFQESLRTMLKTRYEQLHCDVSDLQVSFLVLRVIRSVCGATINPQMFWGHFIHRQIPFGTSQGWKGKKTHWNIDFLSFQVNNIARPSQYETAVKNKEAAKQNIDVALQERPRKLTEAQTKKKEAAAQANITIEKAESNARILLTK